MWLFLLAALHRMQALSALACSVGCGFVAFASLKIALFIQPLKKRERPIFYFWVAPNFCLFIGGLLCFSLCNEPQLRMICLCCTSSTFWLKMKICYAK